MRIKISSIKINPGRREAEPKAVEELARSITAVGLMNPVTLRISFLKLPNWHF